MRHSLLVFTLATAFAAPALAQEIAFDPASAKQLAGPPAEMAAMRAASPLEGAIHSRSALLSVRLDPVAGTQRSRWQGGIPVDRARVRALVFGEPGDLAHWQLRPAEVRGRASASLVQPPVASSFGIGNAQVAAMAYEFDGFSGDRLDLVLEAQGGASTGVLLIEGDPATELVSWPLGTRQRVGDRFAIAAVLDGTPADSKEAVLGRRAGRIETALLRVTDPAGAVTEWPMREDPKHADGTYSADFPLHQAGDYTAQVEVRGTDARGRAFVRTAEHLVAAVAASLEVAAGQVAARRAGDTRVALPVPVRVRAGGPDHYRALAEVWGHDAGGTAIPVAWIGGMVAPSNGAIELGFDERWIDLAGAQPPFELRALRIEDPERSVEVTGAERVEFTLPRRFVLYSARDITVDESMRMGQRPAGMAPMGTGKRLLLVHGYCSGGVWPAGQFGTASTFLDANQNRSNDQFALRIRNFGATWNSFGTVAHSQGGMAALHLYSYYWSGLDNATGNRLLQSVGTPYKGTNIAGILATLGNWFGVGCGKQADLTYSGAASWLAGIPSWARAKVNYYTTSFATTHWWVNDYCQIATDLVLSDPEDGTVEQANAQLAGATNRGHVTGQCHTASMRDPAQYLNSSRNATMNTNAAR
ncbi:MAG: conditioned medium factor [Xanthomonadales bacterium]|nr:conditioned medium factor [Xanthomonadales bacterium]